MKRIHLSPKHQRVLSLVKKSKLCHNSDMEHHNNRLASLKRKCAFTLAEVLITLGIIGVVAAMTLSSVINDAQDKQFKAMFKKQYSAVAQAMLSAFEDGNVVPTFTDDNWTDMVYYVCDIGARLKYVKSGIKCEVFENNQNTSTTLTGANANRDVSWHRDGEWYNKKKEPQTSNSGYWLYTFYLPDGAWINFSCGMRNVFIDVNGAKKPNMIGRDIFYFYIPYGHTQPSFSMRANSGINSNVNACNSPNNVYITEENYKDDCENGSGWGCSPLYILE